nr:uncharacterized protein LOC111503631 [Leptinotarsa decemlineata]
MKWVLFSNMLLLLGMEVWPKPFVEISIAEVVIEATTARPISEEFKDILALIPRDQITKLAEEHLETDESFKAAVEYMQSDEWILLVETVKSKPEWKAFKTFTKQFGVDIDTLIHCSEGFILNANVTVSDNATRSLIPFIKDMQKAIPLTKIIGAFHEKMMKSKAFQEFFEKISSEESKKIVEDVINVPEIGLMMKEWDKMGLNLYELVSLMYTFLGWGEFNIPK